MVRESIGLVAPMTTILTREITSNLIWECLKAGTTQKQMAKAIDIHEVNLCKYKTKVATPSTESFLKILNYAKDRIGNEKIIQILSCA